MGEVTVSEYNPKWADWFNQLKILYEKLLGKLMITIEHVGSTAIPKMVAKPIIDLDVVIELQDFTQVKEKLEGFGYIHQGDLGIIGREAFDLINKDLKETLPPHHLYVCAKNNLELKQHLAFRNFLCKHPKYINQYSQLKKKLVQEYRGNRELYIKGKNDFVQDILKKALNQDI